MTKAPSKEGLHTNEPTGKPKRKSVPVEKRTLQLHYSAQKKRFSRKSGTGLGEKSIDGGKEYTCKGQEKKRPKEKERPAGCSSLRKRPREKSFEGQNYAGKDGRRRRTSSSTLKEKVRSSLKR